MSFVFEAVGLGNGTLVESFFILVTTTIHVPCVIMLSWNVMPTTPHTTSKAHKIQPIGSKSLIFILGFKIVCKHVEHNTYHTIVKGVQHVHDSMKIQQSINLDVEMKHIIQITCASQLACGGHMENILKAINNIYQSHLHPIAPFKKSQASKGFNLGGIQSMDNLESFTTLF